MYTCGCNIFLTEGPFGRVTIVSTYGPIHCFTDQCNVERNVSDYGSWLGFHYLILDQCIVMREMERCFFVWVSSTSFQTLLDIGEGGCGLFVWVYTTSFQTLLDTGGDVCRLLVWAFYYLLAGLLQDNEGEVCRLLVSSPVFTMASPWKFYLRLFGTKFS